MTPGPPDPVTTPAVPAVPAAPDPVTTPAPPAAPEAVVAGRVAGARRVMAEAGIDALVLRPSPDFRFLGGGQGPFLVVTREGLAETGDPAALVPRGRGGSGWIRRCGCASCSGWRSRPSWSPPAPCSRRSACARSRTRSRLCGAPWRRRKACWSGCGSWPGSGRPSG
ncbi:hypothetical protein ACFQQB_55340 [Nonomuraea rubra]|uniref:hypothetical protein n=1 Tax=Nonomuraea rubra TaxID=46180 RepID=UPI003611AF3B